MNRKPNFANIFLSILVGMTLLVSAARPALVSASTELGGGDGIRTSVHPQTGKLSFLGADPSSPIRVDAAMRAGLSAEGRGMAILDVYGPQFGLKNPQEELRLMSTREAEGRGTTKYQQMYQGVPVMAGELIVNTNAQGGLLSINGEASPDLDISVTPSIDAMQAQAVALQEIASAYGLNPGDVVASEPELWIYDARLMNGEDTTPAHLVWRMEITSENAPLRELALVNAQSGKISLHFNQIDTAWGGRATTPLKIQSVEKPYGIENVAAKNKAVYFAETDSLSVDTTKSRMIVSPKPVFPYLAGNTLYVSTTGSDDTNDCLLSSAPCATIQHAIDQSVNGDTIKVAGGTYTTSGSTYGVISINDSALVNITILGGWNEGFSAQVGYSILDGVDSVNPMISHHGVYVSHNQLYLRPTLTMDRFIIQNSNNGIELQSAKLVFTNGAITKNGNGIYATITNLDPPAYFSDVTITNVTIDRNYTAILAWQKSVVSINNSTIVKNTGQSSSTGGIYIAKEATVKMRNSILAQNKGLLGVDCYVEYGGANNFPVFVYNIVGNNTHCAVPTGGGNLVNIDPGFSVYFPAGGYYSFLGSSPVIDAGQPASCSSSDQRGNVRDATCDMGAVERDKTPGPLAKLVTVAGSNQQVSPLQTFPLTLDVATVDEDYDPIDGITVRYTAPNDGSASGTFKNGSHTMTAASSGGLTKSTSFTANSVRGSYSVVASVSGGGVESVSFSLSNVALFVSPTGDDGNTCLEPAFSCATINAAIGKAKSGSVIYIAEGVYKKGADLYSSVVLIDKSVKIVGSWDSTFTNRSGLTIIDGELTHTGIVVGAHSVTIERVQVRNHGFEQNGILNDSGTLTLNQVSVINGGGVGISSYDGDTVIQNSTVSNNWGGIDVAGGTVVIENSTIAENFYKAPTVYGGGIRNVNGTVTLRNSIVANNSARQSPDCYNYDPGPGGLISGGNNIIGSIDGCDISPIAGDKFNVNPDLNPLLPLGYHPIKNPSPARNAGKPATCTSEDQRGIARLSDSKCDIGAYEYKPAGVAVDILAVHPETRRTGLNSLFKLPLSVAVVDIYGSPVGGVSVDFVLPSSGPSGAFLNTAGQLESVTTDSSGFAYSSIITANDILGDYVASADASTIGKFTEFQLHNGAWLVSSTGRDTKDCLSASTPCKTIEGVLNKATFTPGDVIWVASGSNYGSSSIYYFKKDAIVVGGFNQTFTGPGGATQFKGVYYIHGDVTFRNFVFTGSASLRNFGRLIIENSSFYRTQQAILNDWYGYLVLSNVTMTANGNYYPPISNDGGTVIVNNSVITGNKALNTAGIQNVNNGVVILNNSILAGNTATSPVDYASRDCQGDFISLGHNIIGTIGSESGGVYDCRADWMDSDLYGDNVDPVLAADVISPTAKQDAVTGQWYHALKLNGPAIEAGNDALPGGGGNACPATDQLGIPRPQGARCDIGAIEYVFGSNPPDPKIATYSAGGSTNLPGTLVCSGNTAACSSSDPKIKSVHQFAFSAYSQYLTWHGRKSIDGNGLQVMSAVHYGSNYPDTFWNGFMMVFGDGEGFAQADDIVAHEFTHGVTQYESNLFYWYQSGAISEAFADLWGEAIDQANGLGNDATNVKWLIGEDIGGAGAIRNMANPPQFNDPDSMLSSYYCKSGSCLDDNGGVHTNSGVNNKAAYLMVNGGTFGGRTVTALGWTKTLAIYYEAQTNLLTSGSDYLDLYNVLYQSCRNLVGTKGITLANCTEVRDATQAVKMDKQPAANFNPDVPYCPSKTLAASTDLFFDDFETGTDGWTMEALFGTSAWSMSGNAKAGTGALWADDSYPKSDSFASTGKISLPTGAKVYLHFSHFFGFDAAGSSYYDGGVVEYTVNNGSTWVDAKSLFDIGQNYKGVIRSGSGNRLQGRNAFVGDSHGYVDSRYNLSTLAGKTIQFRWRMGTSAKDDKIGWHVDNVKVYRCVSIPAVPTLSAPANNASITDTTPTFNWSDSKPDLHHYELQIAKNIAFTQGVVKYNDIAVSIFTPTTALTPGTYYWRVRAFNAAGKTSAWSTVWKFTIP